MKTFLYLEKNGSAIITLSAPTADEADEYLAEIVKNPNEFRLDEESDDEDEDG